MPSETNPIQPQSKWENPARCWTYPTSIFKHTTLANRKIHALIFPKRLDFPQRCLTIPGSLFNLGTPNLPAVSNVKLLNRHSPALVVVKVIFSKVVNIFQVYILPYQQEDAQIWRVTWKRIKASMWVIRFSPKLKVIPLGLPRWVLRLYLLLSQWSTRSLFCL